MSDDMEIRQPTEIEVRHAVTVQTVDRFKDRPFEWGKYDCARLAGFHLKGFGLPVSLSKFGSYSTALGAKRALTKAGFSHVSEVVSSLGLPEIAAASALLGDVVELPGDTPTGTLAIALGNGRVLGFHEDAVGCVVLQPLEVVRAWKVM